MRITLRQLRVFEAVARHKSVSKGADDACLSQSAASMALKELEQGLRTILFHRNGKHLSINENGRRIQPMVRSLLAMARDLEQFGTLEDISGTLRVAASTTIGNYLLGPICQIFSEQFPAAQIQLNVAVSQEVIQQVESMACDIGLIESPCNRSGMEVTKLCTDRLAVFAAPSHPLAGKTVLSTDDLRDARWCLGNVTSYTRQMLTLGLGEGGLAIVIETNSPQAVKGAVKAGMGLGCLSLRSLENELATGELVLLDTGDALKLERSVNVITPSLIYQGTLQQGFFDALIRHFAVEPVPA